MYKGRSAGGGPIMLWLFKQCKESMLVSRPTFTFHSFDDP